MDLVEHRNRREEQERIGNLLSLLPSSTKSILDAGARDGYISMRLADNALSVTALDLVKPDIEHTNVLSVKGDITRMEFPDRHFDAVLCTEVLEHVTPKLLPTACRELQRVAKRHVLIGVPYKQDIRVSRTTCYTCGGKNPPWSHVNRFDKRKLARLFSDMTLQGVSFVGSHRSTTNALSTLLLDLAGNPFGTYDQEEPCIHCGAKLKPPPERTLPQRLCTRVATRLNEAQRLVKRPQPNWIHILFARTDRT
jgi:ubiquinone/menaquinone biosynthesis C-methylase UbiE